MAQTYQNWELCLCDDGSDDPELTAAMAELAAADPRIKALALEQNGGISRATNRALEAATGEFVVLLDHDDLLDAEALAEIAVGGDRHRAMSTSSTPTRTSSTSSTGRSSPTSSPTGTPTCCCPTPTWAT